MPALVISGENVKLVSSLIVGAGENTVPVDSVLLVMVWVPDTVAITMALTSRALNVLTTSGSYTVFASCLHDIPISVFATLNTPLTAGSVVSL